MFAGLAEILDVRDARGAGADRCARCRVVRSVRGHVDVENRGDQSLAVKLQEHFAVVTVPREQFGLANVGKINVVVIACVVVGFAGFTVVFITCVF